MQINWDLCPHFWEHHTHIYITIKLVCGILWDYNPFIDISPINTKTIDSYPINYNWLVVDLPLWKIWLRQLGWLHFQLFLESHKIPWFQTTNQIYIYIYSIYICVSFICHYSRVMLWWLIYLIYYISHHSANSWMMKAMVLMKTPWFPTVPWHGLAQLTHRAMEQGISINSS